MANVLELVAGQFVRRSLDGMLGRVVVGTRVVESEEEGPTAYADVEWFDEWAHTRIPVHPRPGQVVIILEGQAAKVAASAFADITCERCGGTGLRNQRIAPDNDNRCLDPYCHSGRRAGVSPALDASRVAYEDWNRRREQQAVRDAEALERWAARWRPVAIARVTSCEECSHILAVGVEAYAHQVDGLMRYRCFSHGEPTNDPLTDE